MKRILWIAVCMCLLLSMAACGQSPVDPASGTEPSEVSTPTETTVPVVQHEPQGLEAFDGCYSIAEDHFVQIRSFDGFMILEHIEYEDEEIYDTWVQEFWPDAVSVEEDSDLLILDAPQISLVLTYLDGTQQEKVIGNALSLQIYKHFLPRFQEYGPVEW